MSSKKKTLKLNDEELNDIWSALGYFVREYPNKGAVQTKKAMNKIIKKVRKALK